MADQAIDYAALAEQARKASGGIDYAALAEQARGGGQQELEPIRYVNGMPVYSIDVYNRPAAPPQEPVFSGMDAQGKPIMASPPGPPAAPIPWGLRKEPEPTLSNLDPRTGEFIKTPPLGSLPGVLGGHLLDSFFTGPALAAEGGAEFQKAKSIPEYAGAGHKMISGGLETLTPFMLGAGVAAPLPTALTLAAGTGATAGTEALLDLAHADPRVSAFVGDLVGLYGAHKTLKWLGKVANLPYTREGNALQARVDEAMKRANDPNLSPMERAAAKAQGEGLMEGVKEAEKGSPGGYFFPSVGLGAVPGRPWVENRLNPIQQASQDYMKERGIDTSLSMQTGDTRAAHLEGAVRQSMGGGYANKASDLTRQQVQELGPKEFGTLGPELKPEEAGAAVREKLASDLAQSQKTLGRFTSPVETTSPEQAGTKVGQKLAADLEQTRSTVANQVSPTASTPEIAGAKVLEAGKAKIREFDQAADESYKAAWKAEQDPRNLEEVAKFDRDGKAMFDDEGNVMTEQMPLPVDMGHVQRALKPLADKYEYTLRETDARASLGLKAMRNIINGPRFKPSSAAEMDLGMLKEAARTENLPELRDQSQGLAAASVKELQQAIDEKMANAHYPRWDGEGESPAVRFLRSGRLNTAKKYEVANIFKPFGRNIEDVEPVSAFKRMTWAGDAGIDHLREVATIAPQHMPEVGRAFIDGGGNWKTLGPETKKILFRDPKLISDLDAYYAKKEQFGPLTEKEPVKLFKDLTSGRDANINQLRAVSKIAGEHMPEVGRAFIDSGGKWDELGPETKKALFTDPQLIKNLDEYYAKQEKFGGLTKMNPVDLFNKLTAPEGKPNELLADIKEHAPEQMPGLLRAFVGELWNRSTREGDFKKVQSTLDQWLEMDPKTKALLVDDPKIVSNLNNLFFSMKRLSQEVNPSGSGYIIALNAWKSKILSGLGLLGGGAAGVSGHGAEGAALGAGAGLLGAAGAEYLANMAQSRLLFDPKWTKLLTQGIKFQLQGNEEGARLIGETLSKMASEEKPPGEPPEEPPTGGGPPSTPPGGGGGTPPAGTESGKGPDQAAGGGAGKSPTTVGIYDQLQQAGQDAKDRLKKGWTGGQLYSLFPGDKAVDLATMAAAGVAKGAKSLTNRAIKDMGEWGAARIAGGDIKFPEWKKSMIDDAMSIHPAAVAFLQRNAREIYRTAQQTLKDRQSETLTGKISDIEKILRYAEEGKEGTYWYKHVKPALEPIFGPNTDLFLNFLAATSPRTPVADNVERALDSYSEYLSGKPFSTDFAAHKLNLERAVKGEPLSGMKVGSFAPNLLGDFIRVTVDTWMSQAYGFSGDVSDPQYRFLDYAISQAAKKKGLQPAEMQAAIWTGIKKLEGDPRLTAEPFETVVMKYLDQNPGLKADIEKAFQSGKSAAEVRAGATKATKRRK